MHAKSAICVALLVSGITGAFASPSALADAPSIAKAVSFSGSIDDGGGTCGAFGLIFTYGGERTYIDFYGADGTLLKEIRHITFNGTLTNDLTGASLAYSGRFTRTFDAATNTITTTGVNDQVNGVTVTAGRALIMLDSDSGGESGKDQFDAVVCAALS
jgi:hypothetical protein